MCDSSADATREQFDEGEESIVKRQVCDHCVQTRNCGFTMNRIIDGHGESLVAGTSCSSTLAVSEAESVRLVGKTPSFAEYSTEELPDLKLIVNLLLCAAWEAVKKKKRSSGGTPVCVSVSGGVDDCSSGKV